MTKSVPMFHEKFIRACKEEYLHRLILDDAQCRANRACPVAMYCSTAHLFLCLLRATPFESGGVYPVVKVGVKVVALEVRLEQVPILVVLESLFRGGLLVVIYISDDMYSLVGGQVRNAGAVSQVDWVCSGTSTHSFAFPATSSGGGVLCDTNSTASGRGAIPAFDALVQSVFLSGQ